MSRSPAQWLETSVPAEVHEVLLRHHKIPDPRISKNAADSAWVGEKDWVYRCGFPTPKGNGGPVFLCFDGLDTLAEVTLNGRQIGRFNNMYRRYRVDVTGLLAPEEQVNHLLVVFSSPLRYVREIQVPDELKGVRKEHFLRKCHSDFGSYLGARPHSAKVGIFRDVYLDLPGSSWIDDVWIRPHLSADRTAAKIHVQVLVAGDPASLQLTLHDPAGKQAWATGLSRSNGTVEFEVDVNEPQLWWPRSHGSQPLYQLDAVISANGQPLDKRTVRFGIRDVRMVTEDPKTGEPRFRFNVNGQPIFLRGADLAPLEGMTHCWDKQRATRLLDLMELGRMNVLRIWGEGNIPPQSFYDECDRRGIFVWQDFMFGYGMHPSGQRDFDDNCRIEIEEMIRSLRNHPSLLLWVGGNENHMGWDFSHGTKPTMGNKLFDEIMPQAVARLDPDRLFHRSSPFGGRVPNWPLEGDWHDYTTLKFCPQASVPAYASEVGRVSAPSLNSMRHFMTDEELWPAGHDPSISTPGQAAWPPMWQYRSVGGSWDKVGPLERYCDPKSAEDLIHILGVAHGEYLRERVERERRGVPPGSEDGTRRCWGNMVWRLNDSWPIIYWSVIDYYLEPKIAYYYLRRAYDPVLISFERTADEIYVWVVNDSAQRITGSLTVKRCTFKGDTRGQLTAMVDLPAGQSRRCLAITDFGPIVMRSEFLQATFDDRNVTQLLIGNRYLHLPPADLKVQTDQGKLVIRTRNFAREVSLTAVSVTGTVFEDNYFDLAPAQERTISVPYPAECRRVTVRALNADPVTIEME